MNIELKTTSEAREYVSNLIEAALEGNISFIQIAAMIKKHEQVAANLKEALKEHIIEDMEKYGKGEHHDMGVTFTIKHRTSYDYSNDATYNELKAKLKEREKLLKGIHKEVADTDTGEVLSPPIQRCSTYWEAKL